MSATHQELIRQGFVIVSELLSSTEVDGLEEKLGLVKNEGAGTRNLLHLGWCTDLSKRLRSHNSLSDCLPNSLVAVQCTYFEKSQEKNWLVAMHRDESIPVKERVESKDWKSWSMKEGNLYVRPPLAVIQTMVAVRLSIDPSDHDNGPLEVIPGSHAADVPETERVACHVGRGGALVFKPLLMHASSKVRSGRRRVLHFLFGPASLPDGVEWGYAV